jgi:hypothetical protein
MAGSLVSARAKLERAWSQGIALQTKIDKLWPPRKSWPVTSKRRGSGLEYRFYLGEVPAVDPQWAMDLGDILFNVRCALDHLVYELHVTAYRGHVPAGVERISQFPIFDDETKFKQNGLRHIKNLSKRDIRALRQYQPYITRNDKLTVTRRQLSNLELLHNIDKHRKLHVVTGSQESAYFPVNRFPPECGFESDPTWGPVKSGDEVDRWTFTSAPPHMEDHPGATLEVAIQQGDLWAPMIRLLVHTTRGVGAVLDRFADRFA